MFEDYTRKSDTVKAIQISKDNAREVCALYAGIDFPDGRIRLEISRGTLDVNPSDWLIKTSTADDTNTFEVMTDTDFRFAFSVPEEQEETLPVEIPNTYTSFADDE